MTNSQRRRRIEVKNTLHISVHAEKRFLQRIMKTEDLSVQMLKRAGHWLSQEFDMTKSYKDGEYRFPSFNDYVAVIANNTIVTVRKK